MKIRHIDTLFTRTMPTRSPILDTQARYSLKPLPMSIVQQVHYHQHLRVMYREFSIIVY